jgi:hypothetical protein
VRSTAKCLHSSRLHQSNRNNMKHTACSHVLTVALRFGGNRLINDLFNDTLSSKYSILKKGNWEALSFVLDY